MVDVEVSRAVDFGVPPLVAHAVGGPSVAAELRADPDLKLDAYTGPFALRLPHDPFEGLVLLRIGRERALKREAGHPGLGFLSQIEGERIVWFVCDLEGRCCGHGFNHVPEPKRVCCRWTDLTGEE